MSTSLKSGWRVEPLKNLAKIERSTIDPSEIEDVFYVGLENISRSGSFLDTRKVAAGELASAKFSFTDKHLLYGKLRPYLKKIARPSFSGVCSTDILPILPGLDIDRDYLFYYLRQPSMIDLAVLRSAGANLPRLAARQLELFPVRFPESHREQRRIAAILDKTDALRRKRQEAMALMDNLLQSAFLEMFGDPVVNSKGWQSVKLAKCLRFVTSGSRGWAKHYTDEGARFIRSLDVRMGHISLDDMIHVKPPTGAESERTSVQPGDVLLTITGSRIGRVAAVPEKLGQAYVSQHVAILRPKQETVNPGYLARFLSLPQGGQRQIKRQHYGQTKPGLNLFQIKSFVIPLPPLYEQESYSNFERNIRAHTELYQRGCRVNSQLSASIESNFFNRPTSE